MTQQLENLSNTFKRFAEIECRGSSPLYERLSIGISKDEALLKIAANARQGQPVPNLFLAAIHLLLLAGTKHDLGRFYASLSNHPETRNDPLPSLKDFCKDNHNAIVELLQTRLVQTNVVERCSSLLPGFGLIANQTKGSPLSLIEVGTSAGLNLFWDKYAYRYSNKINVGNADRDVHLAIALKGSLAPPVPQTFPAIAFRAGLDLNTIDVNDDNAVAWLRALVWPEHQKRVENLYGAIRLVRKSPPIMIAGDALETLSGVLADAPKDSTPCVFHSHTLNQFSPEARESFIALIAEASGNRDIYVLSIEGVGTRGSLLQLDEYKKGERRSTPLANCDAHGRWIEWLAATPTS